MFSTKRTCRICGYDLQGLGPDARCPECGRTSRSTPGWLEGLDRAPMSAIVGVVIRHGAIVASDVLLIGLLLLSVVRIPSWYASVAVTGAIGLGIGGWLRVAPAQWPPESRSRTATRGLRIGSIAASAILLVILSSRFVLDAWPQGRIGVPLELWIGGLAAAFVVLFSGPTAAWCRDTSAERILGSSPWVMLTGLCLAAILGGLLSRRSEPVAVFLIVVWWILIAFADVSVLWSAIQCILHRHDHDQVDLRREVRESEWQDEVMSRFSRSDDGDR